MRPSLLSLFIASTLAAAQSGVPAITELRKLFDYEQSSEVAVSLRPIEKHDGVEVLDIAYPSPKGGDVSGYLVTPLDQKPHAAILMGHWGYGTRTEFLPEAALLAAAGAVCLMVDYPWVRLGESRRNLENKAGVDREIYLQAVVDLRRGLDVLVRHPGVDSKRIAYVGHSYGAQFGAILSAVDDRVQAAVLVGGVPDRKSIYLDSMEPAMVEYRKRTPRRELDEYLSVNAVTDAIHFVPHAAPTPLLFQFARYERYFNEEAMKRYAAAASEPKTVHWYSTGHEINDVKALADRLAWLEKKLKLKPVRPLLEARIRSAWR